APILRHVESGEVLAQDLSGGIAVEALGPRVPAGHDAAGIEHEEGVVGDALDQHAKATLALEERTLPFHALGDVARDLGEADQLAVIVQDRLQDRIGPEAAAVLAHAPAFGLMARVVARRRQIPLGDTVGPILGREEPRIMLADDLGGAIALDPLRTG